MTTDDVWSDFLLADTAGRLALVRDPAHHDELNSRLGTTRFRGYQELAARVPDDGPHLGDTHPPNLVFVPGVMGSVLVSKGRGGVWWLDLRGLDRLDLLGLTDDGAADRTDGARIAAAAVDGDYDGFCAAALAQPDFGHITVPYDWRKPISAAAGDVRDAVRTAYAANGDRPVHLVAHSMGGLVVREALRADPTLWSQVDRIAFLATPHFGAPAIAGYLKNHLWGAEALVLLARRLSRATFRSMWGVLSLLPAPAGVYPDSGPAADAHPCANFDLYDAHAYRLGLGEDEHAQLQRVLDGAREFHERLAAWHETLTQERRDRMLVVAGVGVKTLFRLAYKPRFGVLWEHMDRTTGRRPGDRHRDGDGRVPLASAELPFVGETRYVRGVHGRIPGIPAVQEAVFAWLRGQRPELASTPQAALAGDLGADVAGSVGEDPGYLQLAPPDEAALAAREKDVTEGRFLEFAQVKIL